MVDVGIYVAALWDGILGFRVLEFRVSVYGNYHQAPWDLA